MFHHTFSDFSILFKSFSQTILISAIWQPCNIKCIRTFKKKIMKLCSLILDRIHMHLQWRVLLTCILLFEILKSRMLKFPDWCAYYPQLALIYFRLCWRKPLQYLKYIPAEYYTLWELISLVWLMHAINKEFNI